MTPSAQELFDRVAEQYLEADYPGRQQVFFKPDNAGDVRNYNELQARGLMVRRTADGWGLTEAGLDVVLQKRPVSQSVERTFRRIADDYTKAGYPAHRTIFFSPKTVEETRDYKELSARGFLAQKTAAGWVLTDAGAAAVMRLAG